MTKLRKQLERNNSSISNKYRVFIFSAPLDWNCYQSEGNLGMRKNTGELTGKRVTPNLPATA